MKKETKRKGANNVRAGGRGIFIMKLLLYVAPVLLVTGGFVYLGHARDVLPLKEVVFFGNRNLSAEELGAMAGLREGENLFSLSPKVLTKRLTESPWVERVSVRKELFTGRVLVRVQERQPFVLVRKDGALWISDSAGRPLERIPGDAVPILPVIESEPGSHRETFLEALELARLLKAGGYFARPVVVHAAVPPEELSMDLGGLLVKVGQGDYTRKLEKLAELEAEIARRGIPAESIDLRFANRVIVTPVKEVAER